MAVSSSTPVPARPRWDGTRERGDTATLDRWRTLGARYVRALIDQSRFARGLGEPPEPIVTGRADADAIDVTPHNLETHDALFDDQRKQTPDPSSCDGTFGPDDDDTDQ